MTGRDWKPGDVAMVTEYDEHVPAFYANADSCGNRVHVVNHWHYLRPTREGCTWTSKPDAAARPLVVIDYEDRKQVEWLLAVMKDHGWGGIDDEAPADLQAALREFANPTPPIEEPRGLGAVVEDAKGRLWFRMTVENQTWPGEVWQWQYGDGDERWSKWPEINAVRVLSEGWSA